jgi:hypothetical protein
MVAMPLAGAMDLGASTMQGVNASLTTALQGGTPMAMSRTRIQRATSSRGAVEPFNAERALAHALLQLTALSPAGRRWRGRGSRGRATATRGAALMCGDCLDDFFVLPNSQMTLLTLRGILLLQSSEFALLFEALKAGRSVGLESLSPGVCLHWAHICCASCPRHSLAKEPQSTFCAAYLHAHEP